MNVSDIMSRNLVTVHRSATVGQTARLMLDQGLSGVPVVDATGRLLGMVTEEDLVAKHAQVHLPRYFAILGTLLPLPSRRDDDEMRHILGVTAGELMNDDPVTIEPTKSIDEAASLMIERHVNPVPVLDGGNLVGIISHSDIIKILLVEEEDGSDDGSPTE